MRHRFMLLALLLGVFVALIRRQSSSVGTSVQRHETDSESDTRVSEQTFTAVVA